MSRLPAKFIYTYLSYSRQSSSAGFTLTEVLISAVIAVIAILGSLTIATQMVEADRKDFGRTEVQRDMSQALDYMSTELREAIYVYEGECLNGPISATSCLRRNAASLPSLAATLGLPLTGATAVTPVLAFWKLEQVPYVDNPSTAAQNLPTANCSTLTPMAKIGECTALKLARNAYTLVVYAVRQNSQGPWRGPTQIVRYQLRQYNSDSLFTLALNFDILDSTGRDISPPTAPFVNWICATGGAPCAAPSPNVLVDFVDNDAVVPAINTANQPAGFCPPNFIDTSAGAVDCTTAAASPYSISPLKPLANTGFYAFIRRPALDTNKGNDSKDFRQDVVVYLRGNAAQRAGANAGNRYAQNLIPLQAQTQVRSAWERTPP